MPSAKAAASGSSGASAQRIYSLTVTSSRIAASFFGPMPRTQRSASGDSKRPRRSRSARRCGAARPGPTPGSRASSSAARAVDVERARVGGRGAAGRAAARATRPTGRRLAGGAALGAAAGRRTRAGGGRRAAAGVLAIEALEPLGHVGEARAPLAHAEAREEGHGEDEQELELGPRVRHDTRSVPRVDALI